MNRCQTPLLVGMDFTLPDDPREYRTGEPKIGCNRIVCPACDCPVRHFDNCVIGKIPSPAMQAQLYAAMDPFTFPFVQRDAEFRSYLCRCEKYLTNSYKDLPDSDTEWKCAGHPA